MPPFPKPKFDYTYDPAAEVKALRRYRDTEPGHGVPAKASNRVLLATWNVANLGVQDRLDSDHQLIAEIMSWFDLIAVQEVNNNLRGILAIRDQLPSRYELLFSDASGNQERQAFLYDNTKVRQLEEVGRLAIPPSQTAQTSPWAMMTPFVWSSDNSTSAPTSAASRAASSSSRSPTSTSTSAREESGHRTAHPRDLRGRLVGQQAPHRQAQLRHRDDPARRLQPPQSGQGRPDLRRPHLPRPRDSKAHVTDRLGDRLGQPLRPDRVLPRRRAGPVHRADERLRLRQRAVSRPLQRSRRQAVSHLRPLPHLGPPATLGAVPRTT